MDRGILAAYATLGRGLIKVHVAEVIASQQLNKES